MIRKISVALTALIIMAGCETIPPYHAASGSHGYGFSEQKIETNRYRVTFKGNSTTSRQSVENFLLYRAAELTVESGHDYFLMVENDTETHKSYFISSRYPRFGRRSYSFGPRESNYIYPYYSYGFDWGFPYANKIENVHEYTSYTAEAYITVQAGLKPMGNAHAFNAREVLNNLGPFVKKSNKS